MFFRFSDFDKGFWLGVASMVGGIGLASGMEWARNKLHPHRCLGTVTRCVPRKHRSGGYDMVDGTDILMSCTCGRWWTQFIPGTWTPDDFKRQAPVDMDKVVASLTAPQKEENGE